MGQDTVFEGVSILCWLAAPVAMFYGKFGNKVKSVIKSSSVIVVRKLVLMSDQLRVSQNDFIED